MPRTHPPLCPYCHNPSVLVTGEEIYTHRSDLHHLKFFACRNCQAYVGCHRDGTPLGRLANAELRRAKQNAHQHFDPIWKTGRKSRSEAYRWLAKLLNIQVQECHIGMFDLKMCENVVTACQSFNNTRNQ